MAVSKLRARLAKRRSAKGGPALVQPLPVKLLGELPTPLATFIMEPDLTEDELEKLTAPDGV